MPDEWTDVLAALPDDQRATVRALLDLQVARGGRDTIVPELTTECLPRTESSRSNGMTCPRACSSRRSALKAVAGAMVLASLNACRESRDPNLPPDDEFLSVLGRDVRAFVEDRLGREAVAVEYELLRKEPTIVGMSYPKYYAWVVVRGGSGNVVERGALRLAAIEGDRFEVRNFLSASDIENDPNTVGKLFPNALWEEIVGRARAAPK